MPPRSTSKRPKGPPPPADIYVGLLYVSLGALAFGTLMFILELNNYNWATP